MHINVLETAPHCKAIYNFVHSCLIACVPGSQPVPCTKASQHNLTYILHLRVLRRRCTSSGAHLQKHSKHRVHHLALAMRKHPLAWSTVCLGKALSPRSVSQWHRAMLASGFR